MADGFHNNKEKTQSVDYVQRSLGGTGLAYANPNITSSSGSSIVSDVTLPDFATVSVEDFMEGQDVICFAVNTSLKGGTYFFTYFGTLSAGDSAKVGHVRFTYSGSGGDFDIDADVFFKRTAQGVYQIELSVTSGSNPTNTLRVEVVIRPGKFMLV